MSESENPFQHVGLTFIETRLQELADNLPHEVDLDTSELLFLQQAIVLCESELHCNNHNALLHQLLVVLQEYDLLHTEIANHVLPWLMFK